jgi:predicted secreted hydrolase
MNKPTSRGVLESVIKVPRLHHIETKNLNSRRRTGVTTLLISLMLLWCLAPLQTSEAREFLQALPGYQFKFPRDHAAHEDFRTEWWYYTGHLETVDHKHFGYELTFFRNGMAKADEKDHSPWKLNNIYLAHFAVSDINNKQFHYFQKLNRGGRGPAAASSDNYYVYNENWFVEQLGKQMVLRAEAPGLAIHLDLDSAKPEVIHGENGISQKAACKGCASHYYSLTRLQTNGFIYIDGKPAAVTGTSWMDHEFGSNQLTSEQVGWDWFSVQLSNNTELMLYLMRNSKGGIDPNSSGTVIRSDGSTRHLKIADFKVTSTKKWKSPSSKGEYPMEWLVEIPSEQCKLKITPAFERQELETDKSTGVTYWEGASTTEGSFRQKPVKGEAYVEMTGYSAQFKNSL